jgi:pantoate--beta-alanine ligase
MKTVRTIAEVREELAGRTGSVGLVAVTGAFHAGHLSLFRRRGPRTTRSSRVSSYQPGAVRGRGRPRRYLRDEARDLAIAAEQGVDVVFAPSVASSTRTDSDTWVMVEGLSERLEGACPPAIPRRRDRVPGSCSTSSGPTGPTGEKDAQQAALVKQLVHDLNLPVAIRVLLDRPRRPRPGALVAKRLARPRAP